MSLTKQQASKLRGLVSRHADTTKQWAFNHGDRQLAREAMEQATKAVYAFILKLEKEQAK